MDSLRIVQRAEGPAIATDRKSRILAWNRPARELFEHTNGRDIIGGALHAVFDARDIFGNRLDFAQMPFHQMVTRGEPIQGFEINAKKKSGEPVRLIVSVVVILGQRKRDYELVYLLRPVLRRRKADELIERFLANPPSSAVVSDRNGAENGTTVPDLTRRQTDVLKLLAQGYGNEEIASRLFLSVFTVRSHVQALLAKLGVHSKVEAVSRAFRDRLI